MEYQFHDIKERHVFITGGGSGIGAALTEGFLRQGAKVSFVQRSDAASFIDEMETKTGMRPLFLRCDITDIEALRAAMTQAQEELGDIAVLVNNAGNDIRHNLGDYSPDDWDRNHAVNLRPYFSPRSLLRLSWQRTAGERLSIILRRAI